MTGYETEGYKNKVRYNDMHTTDSICLINEQEIRLLKWLRVQARQ